MLIDKKKIKKIAIIRIGKLGDMIVNDFAFKSIRENFPDAKIMLVTMARSKELIQYSSHFDKVFFFKQGLHLIQLILAIRFYNADLLFDFDDGKSGTSKLIAQIGGAKNKVAFAFEKNRKYLTIPVVHPGSISNHISERLRLIPEAVGINIKDADVRPALTIGDKEYALVRQHLQAACKYSKNIAINLSAGHETRYWQQEKWIKLLQFIQEVEKGNVNFILLYPSKDQALADELISQLTELHIITPKYKDFHSFASYIAQSDLLISPDTSAIHIASAFHVTVIALFGCTEWNYISWRPIHTQSETVVSTTETIAGLEETKVMDAYRKMC